jgi:L-lysine 2,3-aminomutase
MKAENLQKINFVTNLRDVVGLSRDDLIDAEKVAQKFSFMANEYYLSLINWDDPDDPIKKIVIPNPREMQRWGRLDPSCEHKYTIMPGLEHKYNTTALLLVSNMCGGICRYCLENEFFGNLQTNVCKIYNQRLITFRIIRKSLMSCLQAAIH